MLKIAQSAVNWLWSLWSWSTVHEAYPFAFQQNTITGRRRMVPHRIVGVNPPPQSRSWLAGGDWSCERPKPPMCGSGVKRARPF